MEKLETPLTWGLAIGLMISLFIGSLTTKNTSEIISVKMKTDRSISDIFEKNCETVSAYFTDFTSETVDYTKYYAANAVIKGTTLGSKDSITVDEHKAMHDFLLNIYDFSYSNPLVFLPGVNPETKDMDGSVRFYCSINVTETSTQKSVSIPMYYSFDFDDNGKFLFQQYYGDINAYLMSL